MGRPPVLGSTLSPNLTGSAMVLLLVSAERREHRVMKDGARGHVFALNGKVIKHGTIVALPRLSPDRTGRRTGSGTKGGPIRLPAGARPLCGYIIPCVNGVAPLPLTWQ